MTKANGYITNDNKILPPKNDVVFKALFTRGKESITKAFLEDILKTKIEKIDLDKSKDLINDNKEDKNGRLDLRAVLNGNIECDIEIQLKVHKYEMERFLYYWSKIYSANLKTGNKYGKLRKTISVIILGENLDILKEVEKSHTVWNIREKEYQKIILTNYLELHIIELSKALKEYKNNPKDEVLQWMMFLDNPENMEVQKIMEENEDIKEAKEELDIISADRGLRELAVDRIILEADRLQYIDDAKEKGRKEGIKEGRKEGIVQGNRDKEIEIIKRMLSKGKSIEEIADLTDIDIENVRAVANEN